MYKRFKNFFALALLLVGGSTLHAAQAATFTVNSTNNGSDGNVGDGACATNGGVCTLRAAIQESNALVGADTINFNIGGAAGVKTILPTTALPAITEPLTINGYSQPGSKANTLDVGNDSVILIEIAGTTATNGSTAAFDGLTLAINGVTISGLCINRFNNGISYPTTIVNSGFDIQGCFIGTDPTGMFDWGNNLDGINVSTTAQQSILNIGERALGARNLISGNGNDGVDVSAVSVDILNTYIGTDKNGTAAIPNGGVGVRASAGGSIGGLTNGNETETRCIIAGNTSHGAVVSAGGFSAVNVYVGVGADGVTALGNGGDGLRLNSGTSQVGSSSGNVPRFTNVISNNNGNGINFLNGTTTATVFNSIIGLAADGTTSQGNVGSGISILSAGTVNVSGNSTFRNIISSNSINGITISSGTLNVTGTFIGVDASATLDRGNRFDGVYVASATANAIIGGNTVADRNIISGNNVHGISFLTAGNSSRVQNNYIGTDANGTSPIPNMGSGVHIDVTPGVLVGGNNANTGNIISANGTGVTISGTASTNNNVRGNLIGVDATGTADLGNANHGIVVTNGATGNSIGGDQTGQRNIISGNTFNGILLSSAGTDNRVRGNYIGTSFDGTAKIGNSSSGIYILNTPSSTIGGTLTGEGNLISGNGLRGIYIFDPASTGNVVQGNLIGTNAAGTGNLGNSGSGIFIFNCSNNTIGGTTAAARNVISCNSTGVVLITGANNNRIQGNYIGTDISGTANLGNVYGITILNGANNNLIGGSTSTAGNIIAFSSDNGVTLNSAGVGNSILSNSIFSNGRLGIDLNSDEAVTPNDLNDPDTGPNNLQNFPVLASAVNLNGTTTISGTLNSTPNSDFTIQFFSNDVADTTGFGEGRNFIGQTTVATGANGNASFSFSTSTLVTDNLVVSSTATNTTTSDTSEFSNAVTAGAPGSLQFSAPQYTINENGVSATITVTRTGGSSGVVTVDYATNNGTARNGDDGTAVAGNDYTSAGGTLTFNNGETSKTFTVPITNDAIDEADETIDLRLSRPTGNAVLGADSTATLTIVDDDAPAAITATVGAITEGNVGTTEAVFTLSLSSVSGRRITVNYATTNGTASAGSDYQARTGAVTFLVGETTKTVTILINGDVLDEADETFNLVLTDAVNATLATSSVSATIPDDDSAPTLSVSNPTVSEGDSGTVNAVFAVTLSAPSGLPISRNYSTVNITAVETDDYNRAQGILSFAPGETNKNITVTVNGDLSAEGDETFSLQVNTADDLSTEASGTATITDDDAAALSISITPSTLNESAGAAATIGTVTRNTQDTSADLLVTLNSSDTLAVTVPASVTILAGQASATFDVNAINDAVVDGTQNAVISATATGFASDSATVTVTDDESPQLTLSIAQSTLSENSSVTATVSRNTNTSSALVVNLLSSDTGEASVPASIVIPLGQTSVTFSVTGVADNIVDGSANVTITASATGLATAQTVVSVTDSTVGQLTLSINPARIGEGDGNNAATGTITRNTSTSSALTVNLTSDDTSEVTVPSNVSIPAGQTSVTFPIGAVDDTQVDGSQTATITAAATGLQNATANVTVNDDDVAAFTLSITPGVFGEAAGSNAATGTVTRNTPTAAAQVVNLQSDDTSEVTVPPTVIIQAGQTSASFSIAAVNDDFSDGTRTVTITASRSGFESDSAPVTVTDNDSANLSLSVAPGTFREDSGNLAATATLVRNTSTTQALTVNLSSNDTSEVRVPANVTIPAGAVSVTFPVSAIDDPIFDGSQTVEITASASGLTSTQTQVTVTDNESAPALGDTVAPSVDLQSQENGQIVREFNSVFGTASELPATRVRVTIQRVLDGKYFDGRGWVSVAVQLPTQTVDDRWVLPVAFIPTGLSLNDGRYNITALASDAAGNVATDAAQIFVDRNAPAVTFLSPRPGLSYSTFPNISGRAIDTTGGTGLSRVALFIRRLSDGRYWNGTSWSVQPVELTTTRNANNFSRTTNLPQGANLRAGQYRIVAIAIDGAGNRSLTQTGIQIVSGGTSTATRSIIIEEDVE